MIFAILTLFAALMLAGVADWFAVIGIMSIYAGAPFHAALIMGVVLAFAKLVTTSWLYRNWEYAKWTLKAPLIYFMLALMVATSIGVFGFLTKSHLEQGAATIDNTAKVERIDQQILREKSVIADNEKIINQLDSAINSYLGKDNADKALNIRKAQAGQRKQLRADIDVSQKQIDKLSEEKFQLQSQVRALQLEVGPIKYIAELFNSEGDEKTKIETAVKFFTLLIVSTLDPLAIILLIAANHTLLRLQNEKKAISSDATADDAGKGHKLDQADDTRMPVDSAGIETSAIVSHGLFPSSSKEDSAILTETTVHEEVPVTPVEIAQGPINAEEITKTKELQPSEPAAETSTAPEVQTEILRQPVSEIAIGSDNHEDVVGIPSTGEETSQEEIIAPEVELLPLNAEITPEENQELPTYQSAVVRELMGTHLTNTNPVEETANVTVADDSKQNNVLAVEKTDKYPKHYSWLKEFKGN